MKKLAGMALISVLLCVFCFAVPQPSKAADNAGIYLIEDFEGYGKKSLSVPDLSGFWSWKTAKCTFLAMPAMHFSLTAQKAARPGRKWPMRNTLVSILAAI